MKRTPLTRKTALKRGGRLNPIGKKARKDSKELAKVKPEVLARGCEFRSYLEHADTFVITGFPRPIPTTCGGVLDAHHAAKRSLGGSNHPSNLICLCRRHHDWTDQETGFCREIGLLR